MSSIEVDQLKILPADEGTGLKFFDDLQSGNERAVVDCRLFFVVLSSN